MTTAILGLMGGLLQINPIWQLGPYKPSQVSAGSQPDLGHDVDRRLDSVVAGVAALHR